MTERSITTDFAQAIAQAMYLAKLAEAQSLAGKRDEAEESLRKAEEARAFARVLLGELTSDW